MQFLFITNVPELARLAVDEGDATIFVDLELKGKIERQGHLNTVISRHTEEDVNAVRAVIPAGHLLVRLNPCHNGSAEEIERAIAAGADTIMLPMFRTIAEVATFAELIARRCRLCLLAETREAMEGIGEFARIPGVDSVHIGLNDLSLDLGMPFMFEPLAMGLIDKMAEQLRLAGTPFGIGGLARADEGQLPARLLIGEHVRLGSTTAILSRTFHRQARSVAEIREEMDFAIEVQQLQAIEAHYRASDDAVLEANRQEVWRQILEIAQRNGSGRP